MRDAVQYLETGFIEIQLQQHGMNF
jgi:hypothetical protein